MEGIKPMDPQEKMEDIHLTDIHYGIEDLMLMAKTGKPEDNEDVVHFSPALVAVIDGATSKNSRRWEGKTGGQVCARFIDQILSHLSPVLTAREAIDALTARIHTFYQEQGMLEQVQADPSQRVIAA